MESKEKDPVTLKLIVVGDACIEQDNGSRRKI